MSRTVAAVAVLAVALGGTAARADDRVESSFRDAQALAASADARAIDAFEAVGAQRPIGPWTDDAWAEAARLAERAGDYGRARRALDEVIATGTDEQLVRRARAARARIEAFAGHGAWDEVARRHERLRSELAQADDPRPVIEQLEQLVARDPTYPRATAIRLAIARGWEQVGDDVRAERWYRDAAAHDRDQPELDAPLELVRALIRRGAIGAAERELASLAVEATAPRARAIAHTRALLDDARRRRWSRRAAWLGLTVLLLVAIGSTRRALGSLRATVRALARPPAEVWFLIPLALALTAVAHASDAVVARAVRDLGLGGVAVAWCSGAAFEAVRQRRGRLGGARVAVHAMAAVIAVALVAYLAIDRDRLVERLGETWRAGPN